MRVVVVGGGVSGLAAAHALVTARPELDVVVLEAAARSGGLLATERTDGFLVEHGPDSMITDKPAGIRLVERLGLVPQPTRARDRGAYVVHDGRLVRIPDGFSLMAPLRLRPFLRSPILSPSGKVRALAEMVLPRGEPRDDESLGSFVTRRFGKELLDRLAQPLVSGIYGADPAVLSLRATMPRFLEAEERSGSVTLALRSRARAEEGTSGVRYGLFVSFADGMQALPDALGRALGDRVRTQARVASVSRGPGGDGWRVEIVGRDAVRCDAVIVALPAAALGQMLRPLDAALAMAIEGIALGSAATATLAFRRADVAHPLDAFGWVTPRIERRDVMASTWASTKFEGRAPSGHVLLRVFLGEAVLDRDDEELVRIARDELRELVGATGAPLFSRVVRCPRALPQYRVGHVERADDAERRAAALPRFALAGTALRGVGIPDAIASGERAAARVIAALETTGG